MLEKEVMLGIKRTLNSWSGVVEYWERLNSGKVQTGSYYVQMARPGTPDFIAIIRNKENNLHVLFIEAKSSTGTLRTVQKEFRDKYKGIKDISVVTISDPKELGVILNTIGIDLISNLEI